jgi:arsenate reductase (thioredoxin)
MAPPYNVLFLCTGNSSRSIMAEAILKHKGHPNFAAYSAGSHPVGAINPYALRQIQSAGLSASGLRSKSWDEFAGHHAPHMDFIFTLCDSAARETCPAWPGHPTTAHWGLPDPGFEGTTPGELDHAFRQAFLTLDRRINLFLALRLASMTQPAILQELRRIGRA